MNWDNIKMAQKFLSVANALHPDDHNVEDEKTTIMAKQDFFFECYMNSFSRDRLIQCLRTASAGQVTIPEDVEESVYRKAYVFEAQKLLKEIEG